MTLSASTLETHAAIRLLKTAWKHAAKRVIAGALAASLAFAPSAPASAQGRMSVIRDAEIEALVRDYARPILKAAGLASSGIEIVLINDSSFNAFVLGRRIFVNTGALMQADTPNEIIGVLAHEAGHIAGGHQQRLRQQLERAKTMALVAGVLGLGAVAAGAMMKSSEVSQAGAGIAAGGNEIAMRGLLGYQRSEEMTADRSAVTYLEKTGQSAKGMLTTFSRFQDALSLSGARPDPYRQSHPMPRERISNLQRLAEASPYFGKTDPPELQLRHDMMRAKIAAYTGNQGATARMFRANPGGLPAKYGDAIATHLRGSPRTALSKADALVKAEGGNPYFRELRGDVLMKLNRPGDAAASYAAAMKLDAAKSGILQLAYAQALVASGDPASLKKAVSAASQALEGDRENPGGYQLLAQAYGQLGDEAGAELATAESSFYRGAYQEAKIFAARAQQKLKRGSPDWLRAQDIISFRTPGRSK
jgi:predicted Zn-dependent protease